MKNSTNVLSKIVYNGNNNIETIILKIKTIVVINILVNQETTKIMMMIIKIKVLMTDIVIIPMIEVLLSITILITLIMITHKMNSMGRKENLSWTRIWPGKYIWKCLLNITSSTQKC